jgi:RNA polymerase sigma factor (sigma-70 family)
MLNMDNLEEEQYLLENFIKADNKIIVHLYKSYLPCVTKYILNNGGIEEDARDVFQEALIVLYKQIKSKDISLTASLKTYIFSICRYRWLNNLRKNKRIESFNKEMELIDLNSDIIFQMEKAERYRLLQVHLSKLSPTDQKILNLYFQKKSTEEIADLLGLSKLYVKKQKYLSKRKLIKSIQSDLSYKEY